MAETSKTSLSGKLILRVKFIILNVLECVNPSRDVQKDVKDYTMPETAVLKVLRTLVLKPVSAKHAKVTLFNQNVQNVQNFHKRLSGSQDP